MSKMHKKKKSNRKHHHHHHHHHREQSENESEFSQTDFETTDFSDSGENIVENYAGKFFKSPALAIKSSKEMGRYTIATREFRPGSVILTELPLVVGPCSGSVVVCLGCYTPILEEKLKNCHKCKFCNWPLCSQRCPGIHKLFGHSAPECAILKKSKTGIGLDYNDYMNLRLDFNAIVPLRCLLLKNSNPESWDKISVMEAHNSIRKNIPEVWNTNQEYVVDRIRKKWGIVDFSEEEIHTICGILEVNAFEVGRGISIQALYPSAFLLAHNCVPNTNHTDEETNFKLTIRASTTICKGDAITLSYANTLQSTLKRREFLLDNKFFMCQCKRCSDPTELNTFIGALKCPKCKVGLVLSTNSLDSKADWLCSNDPIFINLQVTINSDNVAKCPGYRVTAKSMNLLMDRIAGEIDQIYCNDIIGYENFLKRYINVLHPFHYQCLTVKHTLSQLYGKIPSFMIHELTLEQLQRKVEICREILQIFNVLEPGLSRIRGITLYELHAPLMILAKRDVESNTISKAELKIRLKEIVKCLTEAYEILSLESKNSSEGLMAEATRDALEKIRNWQKFVGKI